MLDPLVGVGPLRFGMDSGEVKAALGGPRDGATWVAADGTLRVEYPGMGLNCMYARGTSLVAVAVDAFQGPLVRVGEVELIGRVPSEVRAEIHDLARREEAAVRVNWSGDPEIAAWGVSMGTEPDGELSAEGYPVQKDRVITSVLLVGPELAHDPYATTPVMHWRDVTGRGRNPGAWPVTPGRDRPHWDWVPLERVGPLRFGMSPPQVADALGGEVPAGRIGHFPFWLYATDGLWNLHEDRFENAGVSAHYWTNPDGVPRLGAVTAYGRTGPQVLYADIPLVGAAPSSLGAAILRHVEDHDLGLCFSPSGAMTPSGVNLALDTVRAGDAAVSEPTFYAEHWEG